MVARSKLATINNATSPFRATDIIQRAISDNAFSNQNENRYLEKQNESDENINQTEGIDGKTDGNDHAHVNVENDTSPIDIDLEYNNNPRGKTMEKKTSDTPQKTLESICPILSISIALFIDALFIIE